ncbi:NAD-glutamate dehydrogenase [Speluncibacter jeojiensis]|uniref:NAD-glutamate dehydrogenase n=1 Tax=Speluncibacter jeojiensis TaxID=2710754 RepID=A0A9X4RFP5_9ACTN|nr:NAD-glutamate dehydrogenase [Corynebacteriales bacterium D3-21]
MTDAVSHPEAPGPEEDAGEIAAQAMDDPELAQLYRGYYRQDATVAPDAGSARAEEEPQESPEVTLGRRAVEMLRRHRELAACRSEGVPLVRLWPDGTRGSGDDAAASVLQIVTDDSPFLVESVTALLGSIGVTVDQVVHPILTVERDADGNLLRVLTRRPGTPPPADVLNESWMYLELSGTPQEVLPQLQERVVEALKDVRTIVEDTDAMLAEQLRVAEELERSGTVGPADETEVRECAALLRWLAAGNFRLLGYRRYEVTRTQASPGGGFTTEQQIVEGSALGVLRSGEVVDRRFRLHTPDEDTAKQLLVLTQGQSPPMVMRSVHPFFVCVRTFDAQHRHVGEHRFLGIFTVTAIHQNVLEIPILGRRARQVLELAGQTEDSYNGQSMLEIIESYPRTELFATDTDTLLKVVSSVLSVGLTRDLRLFLRGDANGNFVSALVYLPRDRYRTGVRLAMKAILLAELGGSSVDYTTRVTESSFAMVHFTVHIPRGWEDGHGPDLGEQNRLRIQSLLAESSRSWEDRLSEVVTSGRTPVHAAAVQRYAATFPEAYKEDFTPEDGLADIARLQAHEPGRIQVAWRRGHGRGVQWRFMLYLAGAGVSLSQMVPILQSLAVDVIFERPYPVLRDDGMHCWIYAFAVAVQRDLVDRTDITPDSDAGRRFIGAFEALWYGHAEVDRFNELVLRARLDWRQAMLLRAYGKYLRQAGFPYSQTHIETVLCANPDTVAALVELFHASFDPDSASPDRAEEVADRIAADIKKVYSLDTDRVLRAYLALIRNTLRTNYFMTVADGRPHEYLSIKLASRELAELPQPRPMYEIYVYAPRVEGVHLRFGPVSRGGLRWSDRREDFRTEVLGLAKAQAVKNAVIVPVGAKGGFVVKNPPTPSGDAARDRDALREEGIACYRRFISGLLDLTDNLDSRTGQVIPPDRVVRRDVDDTYLVVAADKGTATFSDIANEVSKSYGYWLGDAFASGGSAGYDHKEMGITAKGAWESVKRHFRELGLDTQSEEFTAVGIGDMSGDVFGNGMLLSEHIRLVAAFDHRHIFIDPTPVAATSIAERRRLFALPRSSWADYDTATISEGGGVWERQRKSIPVSPQVRAALGLPDGVSELPAPELVRAILLAPVDLLWNGGIGTYVKSAAQSNADVGDKANDSVRVNGSALRAKVIGEGGNLGLTQLGRIEFALAGGKVNTDAVDNSAGVDCSDHEVNIKILLDNMAGAGQLAVAGRTAFLESMTDEVAELVLDDNRRQNEVLGISRAHSDKMLGVYARLIDDLVRRHNLDRDLEALPSPDELDRRSEAGIGLTSPEMATLLAHVKLALKDDLLATDLPDLAVFANVLPRYFPGPLRERFGADIKNHPLSRQIVATMLANDTVDGGGITYVYRLGEDTGTSATDAVRAFTAATTIFDLPGVWEAVRAAGAPVVAEDKMMLETRRLLDRAARWLLANRPQPLAVGAEIARFADKVSSLAPQVPGWLAGSGAETLDRRAGAAVELGAPEPLARRIFSLLDVFCLLDIIEIADIGDRDGVEVAELYYALAAHLDIERLLTAVAGLPRGDRWHSLAQLAIRDDLYSAMRSLCMDVLSGGEPTESPAEKIAEWESTNASRLARARGSLAELAASGTLDLAGLSVATRQIRSMVRAAGMRAEAAR